MPTDSFSPPSVRIGDCVYWYSDAVAPKEPCLGWIVVRPGINTVTILVFSPNAGFQEKPSVRHKDDPGLQENAEWRAWGCWELAPATVQLRKLETLIPQVAAAVENLSLARKNSGGNVPAKNG